MDPLDEPRETLRALYPTAIDSGEQTYFVALDVFDSLAKGGA